MMMAKLSQSARPLIFRVAVAVPLHRLFDYLAPTDQEVSALVPGIRLEVPFANGSKIAYLVEVCQHSELSLDKLKPIVRVLDESPLLSKRDMELLQWASGYYHHPIGEVFNSAIPVNLRKGHSSVPAPPKQTFLATEKGISVGVDILKRSTKQQSLLRFFQENYPNDLTEADLLRWDKGWRPVIKALLNKGLIQSTQVNTTQTGQGIGKTELLSRAKATELINTENAQGLQLNTEQQAAVTDVCQNLGEFAVYLLEGITGSGKTEVYMHIIQKVLEREQQVLVLVPEINLTPQLEARFRQRFPVAMTLSHSNLTNKQRHGAWLEMQQGSAAILLGTRSTLFTPLKNPGLIILDEEHDASFKQQEGFRFSARDVAIMRGKLLNIPVLLGTATPSLESLHNAKQKRYRHLTLSERAGKAAEPYLHLVDIRNKKMQGGLSDMLVEAIKKVLANKEQAMLFLNRRGFAPTLICHSCGWVARCRHCDANLVIHSQEQRLRCHHCGREQRLFLNCPACKTGELMPLGLGTERIEEALRTLFPNNKLVRLDRDTTQRKGTLERYLEQIHTGEAEIILGTQMLAKGHHFSNVTLVAIVDVDSGLFSIDYRATERLAQMIVQVSGRAGRAEKQGHVLLQTRHPDHPLLNTLIREGYRQFAQIALAERKQAALPPFSYQALLRAQGNKPGQAFAFLQSASALAKKCRHGKTQILGPVPAPMEKRAGLYRYQLLFQSGKRQDLQQSLGAFLIKLDEFKPSKAIRWSLDVDPVDLY